MAASPSPAEISALLSVLPDISTNGSFNPLAGATFINLNSQVHDRAQVYVSCPSASNGERPLYVGTVERWANSPLHLPSTGCASTSRLLILVENMGRVNYGQFMFDKKGILSSVYIDGQPVHRWKMFSIPLHKLNEVQKITPMFQEAYSNFIRLSARKKMKKVHSKEPVIFTGSFVADKVKDTFISFKGWGKGVAIVNGFNIGRYWPSFGPQCNLYVPAPILRHGENVLVILELESPNRDIAVKSVDKPDFTCGSKRSRRVHQL